MKHNGIPPLTKVAQEMNAKHFRNLDAKIRKRWNKLYQYRKGRNRSIDQANGYSVQLYSDQSNPSMSNSINPRSIQHIRAQKNRLATHQRYKKNNEIFYKKRNSDKRISQQLKEGPNSQKTLKDGKSFKMISLTKIEQKKKKLQNESQSLPFMLQRRKKKLQKSIQIISFLSQLSFDEIRTKKTKIFDRRYSEQRKLIDKMKGTKIYYNFIREWKTPTLEDLI